MRASARNLTRARAFSAARLGPRLDGFYLAASAAMARPASAPTCPGIPTEYLDAVGGCGSEQRRGTLYQSGISHDTEEHHVP